MGFNPGVVELLHVLQIGVGNELGPQGVAGQQNGLCDLAHLGGDVGGGCSQSGHNKKLLSVSQIWVLHL